MLEQQQRLRVLDLFSDPDRMEALTLAELFDEIHGSVSAESTAEHEPASVVMDDLSALKWRFGPLRVVHFLRCCKALTHEASVSSVRVHLLLLLVLKICGG
jgi:hypothetical protein